MDHEKLVKIERGYVRPSAVTHLVPNNGGTKIFVTGGGAILTSLDPLEVVQLLEGREF